MDTERNGDYESNFTVSYAITYKLLIFIRPAKSLTSLRTVEPISHCCPSGKHSYRYGPLADTNASISKSTDLNFHAEKKIILNFIKVLPGTISFYVSTMIS